MELIVLYDGQEERLEIERRGQAWEVRLGERRFSVDATPARNSARSLLIDGRQFEVSVRGLGSGRYQVASGGGLQEVTVEDPLSHLARASHEAGAATGAHQVAAYMPGRVVQVLVEEGQTVEAGQGVVVLEAMKMENEIQADAGGVLHRLLVGEGDAVEAGDPLFEIE